MLHIILSNEKQAFANVLTVWFAVPNSSTEIVVKYRI